MSETGFRMFNDVFSIGAELAYAVLLTAFFKPFMTNRGPEVAKAAPCIFRLHPV